MSKEQISTNDYFPDALNPEGQQMTEAEFREAIRLEVPNYIPVRPDRLTDEEIEVIARDPVLRPEVVKKAQQKTLDALTTVSNNNEQEKNEKEQFMNLPIKEVLYRMSNSWVNIIDDLLNKPENKNWTEHIQETFSKDDRLIYFGLSVSIMAILLSLIRSSSQN